MGGGNGERDEERGWGDGTEGRWMGQWRLSGGGVGSLMLFQLRRPQMIMQHSHCPILQQCCWDFPKFLIHELDLSMTGLPQGISSFHTDSFVKFGCTHLTIGW